jgi:eukaryotic-like serine/threonine-protein kinase
MSAPQTIAHYRITAKLGEGGMGEVWRATDTKLGRDVAIKILPASFARDPARMARFEREAKVLASLNHPHIAQIYGVEEGALVIELVEGEPLKGPLPVEKAVEYAEQILDALDAAHQKGIVHRDLKPANILVTKQGIKLLDFGLAKLEHGPIAESDETVTLTKGLTRQGQILGTLQYMSPEQLNGKEVDSRSDLFSFGCVLYEMLSGKRAFDGKSTASVIAAVLERDPAPLQAAPPLERVVKRALAKDPEQRFQTARDLKAALSWALEPQALTAASHNALPYASERKGWIAAIAVLLVALAGLSILYFRARPPQERSARFQIALPGNTAVNQIHLSPDGRYLAIAATGADGKRLWVRPLDSLEARALPGTEGASFPFWSPDSAFIGFFAQGKLKKIALTGGPPQTLCDAANGRGGTWNRDGVIVFAPTNAGVLYRVPAAGGVPAPVTNLAVPGSQEFHRFPEFLPGGRRFLYEVYQGGPNVDGIYAGSLDGARPVRILPDQSNAAYVSPNGSGRSGRLLFRRGDSLMAQPFDPERLRLSGEMFPVAEQVGPIFSLIGSAAFSASDSGVLAYWRGGYDMRELVLLDRSGKRLGVIGKPDRIAFGWLSPDEKRVVFAVPEPTTTTIDIWLSDLARGTTSRFTFGGINVSPIWSPDGSRIAFLSGGSPVSDIYQKPANLASQPELLLHVGRNARLWDWSRDGKFLVYTPDASDPKTKSDLWLVPLTGDRKPFPYLNTQFDEQQGQFSPDGRWMAYASDESGQDQVYIQPIPPTGAKWQISVAGGAQPRWRRDGKELFYIAADQKLMAVPVKGSGAPSDPFEAGASQALFATALNIMQQGPVFQYQPTADGQRFLFNVPAGEESGSQAITVVLNWQRATAGAEAGSRPAR